MCVCVYINRGLFNINITTSGKIWKTAGHIDPKTVYLHTHYMYTLKNSRQKHAK